MVFTPPAGVQCDENRQPSGSEAGRISNLEEEGYKMRSTALIKEEV